jgi:hypothetical protein
VDSWRKSRAQDEREGKRERETEAGHRQAS